MIEQEQHCDNCRYWCKEPTFTRTPEYHGCLWYSENIERLKGVIRDWTTASQWCCRWERKENEVHNLQNGE